MNFSVGTIGDDVFLEIDDQLGLYSIMMSPADATQLGVDLITHANSVDQRTTRADGGTIDEDVCPRCGEPITAVSISGPEQATLQPCGHEISADNPVLDDVHDSDSNGDGD